MVKVVPGHHLLVPRLHRERAMDFVAELVGLDNIDILLVDDDPDLLHLLQKILGNVGATVRARATVAEALDAIRERAPHVVVSDLDMPEVDGYDFVRQIRALPPPVGTIPAIALTAHSRRDDRAQSLAAGFTVHLGKPMRALQLIETIRTVLAQPRAVR